MTRRFRTQSGSIYEVDGNRVRRIVRSAISDSERVAQEWREAESVRCAGVGHPIVITWGWGRDEHSSSEKTIQHVVADGDSRLRLTMTTPVAEITDVQ